MEKSNLIWYPRNKKPIIFIEEYKKSMINLKSNFKIGGEIIVRRRRVER